jgi:hypothetical protein
MVDFCIPDIAVGHILDLYAGRTTYEGRVIWPPLFLHNVSNKLGRHIFIYTGIPYQVSRLYRHI